MTIYVSHSRAFDYKNKLYQPIRDSILNNKHKFILPHETSDNPYPSRALFDSGDCNLIIAEVSYPSTGQGIELGWASYLTIPIIALHRSDAKISGSTQAITPTIYSYSDDESLLEKIKKGIQKWQK